MALWRGGGWKLTILARNILLTHWQEFDTIHGFLLLYIGLVQMKQGAVYFMHIEFSDIRIQSDGYG
jgi:hypothetical protein